MFLQVPKLGYIATEPGSWLQFTVNTASTTRTGIEDPHTMVTLSHLCSYENMGQAREPLANPTSIPCSGISDLQGLASAEHNGTAPECAAETCMMNQGLRV